MAKKKKLQSNLAKEYYPRVTVKWLDTFTLDSWLGLDDVKLITPLECATTGYVISQTEEHIVLVQTIGSNRKCFGTVAIPRPMIIEVLKDED